MAWLGDLTVRTRLAGGAVAAAATPEPPGWVQARRHLVLLVHGFNNSRDEARASYSLRFTTALADVVHFYWPGDTRFGSIASSLSYPGQITSARDSAARLLAFLQTLVGPDGTPAEVSFVCHSLGSRLALEVLRTVVGERVAFPAVRVVALLAAAVPVDLLEAGAVLEPAARLPRTLAVYYSRQDRVLEFAFPAGQAAAYPLVEDAAYTRALGRFGEPPGLTPYRTQVSLGHGDYWPNPWVASDVGRFFGLAVARTTPAQTLPTRSLASVAAAPARALPSAPPVNARPLLTA